MSGAFDLLDRPLLYLPIKWPGLKEGEDGEAVSTEHVVDVQVEILDRPEFEAWVAKMVEDAADPKLNAELELAQFKTVAKGWRGVKSRGKAVAFNDENVATLLAWPGFVQAFGAIYMEAWAGKVATREGNSAGSLANGPADEPIDATPRAATLTKGADAGAS